MFEYMVVTLLLLFNHPGLLGQNLFRFDFAVSSVKMPIDIRQQTHLANTWRKSEAMPLSKFFADEPVGEDVPMRIQNPDSMLEFKRLKQTQKARNASLVSKTAKRYETARSSASVQVNGVPGEVLKEIQQMYLTPRVHYASTIAQGYEVLSENVDKRVSRARSRCTWSLLCCLARFLEGLLLINCSEGKNAKYVINTIMPDDTNTRMKGPNKAGPSICCTVMNQVQNCIVTYDGEDGSSKWDCLAIPCPTTILNTPDAVNLHEAYTSYLISGARGMGRKLQSLGLPQTTPSLENARWAIQIMCGDALEANSSAFHVERRYLASKHRAGVCCNQAALRIKCCNHQLGLIRKPCVLGVERFWSTLVRLAHLYESASFRRRIAAGVVTLLGTAGTFQSPLSLLL